MIILKPCHFPHCKSEYVDVVTTSDNDITMFAVQCSNCNAFGPTAYSEEDAAKLWNGEECKKKE